MKITYKGYHAQVEFDEEARLYRGEVANLRDVITFQAEPEEAGFC